MPTSTVRQFDQSCMVAILYIPLIKPSLIIILDTSVERNTLMETIYPKLKVFCQKKGFEFQVVDMRWGVRDEATDDHMTTELCMKELYACQKLSTGPNFIVSACTAYDSTFIVLCQL